MSTPATQLRLSGLARHLVRSGLLKEEEAYGLQEQSQQKRIPLVSLLIKQSHLTPPQVALAAAEEFGIPLFDLSVFDLEYLPKALINEKLVRQNRALPLFQRGNRLFVAISDPMNLGSVDELKFNTGIQTEPLMVEDDKLDRSIEEVLSAMDSSMSELMGDSDLEGLDRLEVAEAPEDNNAASTPDQDDAPVVRYVNKVLLDAIKRGASDIHFEPYEKYFRLRLRIDGMLHEVARPPVAMAARISSRIKVMSRMDVVERRKPQDGRIKLQISKNRAIDFRVNSLPTLFGEKIVLRILDPTSAQLGVEALGFEEEQRRLYLSALKKPYGMILVTGPTGSGKTVTLYTGLGILNTEDRNISTAEDPAEINMPGINQVNVNPKVGLTFAEALRAFLRQDPDIVMVGEIRDLETAEISIKAAQTGHLVLSTLHTNDAPQTLTRLMNMGVPAYNIANSVSLIIAQRLARRLCPHCKQVHDVPNEALLDEGFDTADVGTFKLYKPNIQGCNKCSGGYKGRLGIYQVMPVSDEMGRMIMAGSNAMDIAAQAKKEGVDDLRASGLRKVKDGVTSLDELNRVTKD
ncbi:type IV-A pilus assembly ATPase PilB [Acidihalobacter yilgarnensis]|uniref:Type IV-A pilus assembly ATPase PilB n=1 Tax=Acidihalobacter yilgarnensis TaxID=2819280 RepID=A0A1D8IR65_9GAMM|nr:type IV-A pilus assembly ATPase PilB [Acidihalobacter yilgarnensis]AOU98992.1 type IV-A pilus assembly ATPase PilB [Acidihalobacter yilgarnensis]